jgi:hypothetical protein
MFLAMFMSFLLCVTVAGCGSSSTSQDEEPNDSSGTDTGDATSDTSPLPASAPAYQVSGTHYYVDANTGSDTNPGTSEAPFQTLPYALTQVTGGDGIYLRDGDYGDLSFGAEANAPIDTVFDDWVTTTADNGHSPVLGRVELGIWNRNGYKLPFTQVGNSDLWLRIDGVTISNQLAIYGSRHVDVRNCTIQTEAELTALTASGSCVDVMNGQYVSLYDNDISHCGTGVAAMTTDFVMAGNEIHNISHDGLKIYGGYRWVVENNAIHDLDDGLSDTDPDPDNRNNHCDCIHMHTIIHEGGYSDDRWAGGGGDVVIRANLFCHAEAMDMMVNQNDWDGIWGDFTIENNLFGPSGGMLVILASSFTNLTVRHNTVLFAPGDVWTSFFGRTMASDGLADPSSLSYFLQIWHNGPEVQVYNNILAGTNVSEQDTQDEGVVTNNLFISDDIEHLPYTAIPGNIQDFIDGGGVLGQLVTGSAAQNAGTTAYTYPGDDVYGTPRSDGAPDIGAVEQNAP